LGAQRRQVEGLVMREATAIALIGLALGLTTTLVAAQGLRTFLFAVGPTDAMTLGVATAVLATAAVVAIYWPARRAARLEPVRALRGE
jgi:putative ABC transport system permease protein